MTKTEKRTLQTAAAVVLLIVLARACLYLRDLVHSAPWEQLLNFVRIYIYLGLLIAWIISVRRRVVQTQARRYLLAAALLMLFWLVLRQFKWGFVHDPDAIRFLWYLYYVPLLLIPTLTLFVSVSLGRPEHYRLPPAMAALLIPALLLIALVLTNDLHQLVFRFPEDAQVWLEENRSFAAGFFAIVAWAIGCSLAAFAVMVARSRIPRSKRVLWLPIIPFGIALTYLILYSVNEPVIRTLGKDLAVVYCLIFTAFFESCIRCGLIQSNTRYMDLFRAFMGSSAQIVDREFRVRYAAENAGPIPEATMRAALEEPVMLEGGRRLHCMPIRGGYAVWTEDVAELYRLRETLEDRQEELQERNALLQYEYDREKNHQIVEAQNRLYDLLQSETQTQLDKIENLTRRLKGTKDEADKRRLLAEIVVLGSYIKRRKDFALSLDTAPTIPEGKLANAMEESFRALRLLGIQGGFLVQTERESFPGRLQELAYDAFEDVMESVLQKARYLNVRVCPVGGTLRLSILTDCAETDEGLRKKYPALRIELDEDGAAYMLPLKGGGDA